VNSDSNRAILELYIEYLKNKFKTRAKTLLNYAREMKKQKAYKIEP